VVEGVNPGALYHYRLDGQTERPDPASRFQPQGVHGPSQVLDGDFPWDDADWSGLPLEDYIFYELHVGTFTPDGTFAAILAHLDELSALGITALQLMPVAQFPGERNWGYDGVFPFAVQDSYGGPHGLKQLVNACHQRGLAVVLDVVYNHLGPEGNYLGDFGPYFTDRYKTPWGLALNFDGPHSDEVRRFFIDNALYWIT
jgi:maltooligosyltrehalose trehalohydrolase